MEALRGNPADRPPAGFGIRLVERRPTASLPFEEVRADVGLSLDRIVVAKDAVGDERIARGDIVLVELDRVQADDRGVLAAAPSERRRARRLFAGRDRFREHITLDEGFKGPDLNGKPPVDVEGCAETGREQDKK